ncbi:MAG: zinc ribbon domain-containing protein [Desulfobacterales bacterium]|nr:zinc ribbon domain-containing protein [Desulfobacterales bacterium]
MPIYEFYCQDCHMIFNFFSKSVNTEKRPLCPECAKTKLNRHMSIFATPHNLSEDDSLPLPDLDENKMERAMNLLAKEAEHIDENDPRQTANLMRKLTDMTGLDLGPGMEEALQRMESGENPEDIEAEMGDILEDEEPFALKKNLVKATDSSPPKIDDKLYDL